VTQFKIGDRVRLSAEAIPERIADIGDMLGTIRKVHSSHAVVEWDIPDPKWDGPDYGEIELAPTTEPTLVETLRAKATDVRAEADAAFDEYQAASAAVDTAFDRMIALRNTASALEAAAKILEEAE
jgi:hypothetical protein